MPSFARIASAHPTGLTFVTAVALAALIGLAGPSTVAAVIEDHQDIDGPFASGPEVTSTCLDCHDDVAADFMKTSHWTWSVLQDMGTKGTIPYGKKSALNNYCLGVAGNWPRCTSCHAGYGWQDASFDFEDPEGVDCLVCHDQTGTYRKFPTGAGHPVYEPQEWQGKMWEPVDLAMIARSVGLPTRENCGQCHFFGGGGNAVKHGDLDTSLLKPERSFDVHMSADGADMVCQECHTTESHDISGNAMADSPSGDNHLDCTSCHEDELHDKKVLNWHTRSLACQACHIPTFAKDRPTNVWWDWSDAGADLPKTQNEYGQPAFMKAKGSLKWEKNIVPTYAWYNGTASTYHLGDKMNPEQVTRLNWPNGNKADLRAKIYPFKIHGGKQPYDSQQRIFINPKVFGPDGFWTTFDWSSASELGMAAAGLQFSGEYGFAETIMYWKINHMVVPADQALNCADCHAEQGSRLDWQKLGYDDDPMRQRGLSRYQMNQIYE